MPTEVVDVGAALDDAHDGEATVDEAPEDEGAVVEAQAGQQPAGGSAGPPVVHEDAEICAMDADSETEDEGSDSDSDDGGKGKKKKKKKKKGSKKGNLGLSKIGISG